MNVLDDTGARYRALRNRDGQWSLWPDALPVPDGWVSMCDPMERALCIALIERSWSDMRPASLLEARQVSDG